MKRSTIYLHIRNRTTVLKPHSRGYLADSDGFTHWMPTNMVYFLVGVKSTGKWKDSKGAEHYKLDQHVNLLTLRQTYPEVWNTRKELSAV